MPTQTQFENMNVTWIDLHQHMIVRDQNGTLMMDTDSNFFSDKLSIGQRSNLISYYESNRRKYKF